MDDGQGRETRAKLDVRGTRDGLVIRLSEDPSSLDLVQDIQDDIEHAGDFFQRGELTIDYGTRQPDVEEIRALGVMLEARGIHIRTVTAGTPESRSLLESWGFTQPRQRSKG